MGLCYSTSDAVVHSSIWHPHDEHRGQEMLEANPSVALARHPKIASLAYKRQTNLTRYLRPGLRAGKTQLPALCTAVPSFTLQVQCIHLFLLQGTRTDSCPFPSTVLCSALPTASVRLEAAPHDSWDAVLKLLVMVFVVQNDASHQAEKKETCPKTPLLKLPSWFLNVY